MNLDFLWTWAVVPSRRSFLHTSLYSLHALICSSLSVQKFYPEARRRFLVDKETYELLKSKNLIDLWDSVEVIEFPKESPAFQKYYAFPKLYTYRFIENPTFILDVECIFKKRVEIHDNSAVQGPAWMLDEKERPKVVKWLGKYPEYKQDYFPIAGNRYISAAHLYIPSPEVGKYVSLKAQEHLEALLSKVPMQYGGWVASYVEDGYITHCFEECCWVEFRDEFWDAVHHDLGEKWSIVNREKGVGELDYIELIEKEAGLKGTYNKYLKKASKFLV